MEFRQVEHFLAVVDHGGVSKAADALQLAQPSMSKSIKTLEREVGAPLFHRVGRGLTLTATGRALVPPARNLLRKIAIAREAATERSAELVGSLSIAGIGECLVPVLAAIGRFRARHPGVTVRIDYPALEEDVIDCVVRDTADIGYLYLPADEVKLNDIRRSGLEIERLGVREFRILLPPGAGQDLPDPLPAAMIADLGLATMAAPEGAFPRLAVERVLRAAGARTRLTLTMPYRRTHVDLVVAGAGAAFVSPERASWGVNRGAVARRLDPPITSDFARVWKVGARSAVAAAFIDIPPRPQ